MSKNATAGKVIAGPNALKRIAARRDKAAAAEARLREQADRLRRKAATGTKLVIEYQPKPR